MAAPLIEAAAKLAESRELAPDLFRSMECVIGRHTDSMRYHIADELRRTPHLREDVSNLVLELDRIILTYLDEWPPDSPSDLGHRMAAAYTKARSLSGKVGYDDRGLIQRDHESLGTSLDRALSLSVNERVPGLSKLQGLSDLACVVSTDRTPRLLTDLVRAHPPPDGGAFAESYLRAVAIAVSRKNDPDAASDLAELLTRDFEPGSGREIRDPRARFGAVLVLASTQRLPESAIRRLKSCAESHERHAKLIDRILEHGRTD